MAKEKFERAKPHINFGSWFKEKLGFGAPPPEEPPIEPLDEEDKPLGQTFDAEDALGVTAIKDTDGDGVDEVVDGWGQPAAFADPADAADPDTLYRVKVKFPNVDDEASELANSDGAQPAAFNPKELTLDKDVPWQKTKDEDPAPDQGNDIVVAFEHGDSNEPYVVGSLWNAPDEPPPSEGLSVEEGSDPSISHDHVYQHNQTDLDFNTQRAGDPDQPIVLGTVHNADSAPADDRPGDVGMIRPGNYQATPPHPAGADEEPSTLVQLDASDDLEPLGGHDPPEDFGGSLDEAGEHLSDRLRDLG
jgi:hypothetical protein